MRTLFDLLPDYIYVKDAQSRFITCNERCARGMGAANVEALVGKTDADFYPAEQAAKFRIDELAVLAGQPLINQEECFTRPDGVQQFLLTNKLPLKDRQGKIIGLVGSGHDITNRKLLEQKFLHAQRLEAIGTLAGGVAHDLNNILAPMLMAAGLLKDKMGNQRDRDILVMVEHGAQRGANIIKQLLTFSRGAGGVRGSVQPRHLVKEMAHLMAETFPRDIEICHRAPQDLWCVVADATQLDQVLMNLCVNARDAMPQGGKLTLEASNQLLTETDHLRDPQAVPGPYVVLAVTDTGHGIPREIIARIFDPFFTTKGVGKGTGLGLSTVLAIAKSHAGFVTVDSEPGQGTVFKVYLPATAEVADHAKAGTAVPFPSGQGELILVVDDEAPIRQMTRQYLELNQYRVLTADDGEEAIKLYIQYSGSVRLVVTDLMMPSMGGVELIQALRVLDPGVKVVAISGLDQQDRRSELAALGIEDLLAKPFESPLLLKAVARALNGKT